LDPNIFHNIEQSNLQYFFYRTDEVEYNNTPKFIGFPLNISIGLLDNQYVSVVSTETCCTVASTVNRCGRVKEPWIAIWHVATSGLAKPFSGNTKPVVLPFS
jgi:hypothetical protein